MIIFTNLFIVIVITILIYIYIDSKQSDLILYKSTLDHRNYLVRNLPDKDKSSNLLAKCRLNISKLINYLLIHYGNEDRVKRFIAKYNPNNFSETAKGSKYTSYSINKGEKIVICLRTRDNREKLIEYNTIMFVVLHELSHIMTLSVGHTNEFWDNFRFLLKQAIASKVYKHHDFRRKPVKYCGTEITDTPLND